MPGSPIDKPNLVIMLGAPFTQQNFERMGIPILSDFFNVYVFDCLKWLGRSTDDIDFEKVNWDKVITVDTKLDFQQHISELEANFAIDFIIDNNFLLEIMGILSKAGVTYVIQKTGMLPVGLDTRKFIHKLVDHLMVKCLKLNITRSKLLGKVLQIGSQMLLTKNFSEKLGSKIRRLQVLCFMESNEKSVALLAGSKSLDSLTSRASQRIWTSSNDYWVFQKALFSSYSALKELMLPDEFILFIDDALVDSSDFKLLGIPKLIRNSEEYYAQLNAFFLRLEKSYGVPVMISGHPNSFNIPDYPHRFAGRKVIFKNTAELVLNSIGIVTHASTAISFAVLSNAPIMLITTTEIDRSFYGRGIKSMADAFGIAPIFLNEIYHLDDFNPSFEIQKFSYYRNYERNYIRNELTNETEAWKNFTEYALHLENKLGSV